MILVNNSLSVVLIGDWNKLYIQPDWMAEHVYERSEIEIGVNGQGADFSISYRCDDVIIVPEQSNVIFSATDIGVETMDNMARCINNFLEKAYTPSLFAYGINCDFIDEDASVFADMLDGMSDSSLIIDNGYEIVSTKVSRTLLRNEKIMNMETNIENAKVKMHFNEHYGEPDENPNFSVERLQEFVNECIELVRGLGYEMEGEDL